MRRLNTKIIVIVLLLMVFSSYANAAKIYDLTEGNYVIPDHFNEPYFFDADILSTYNGVAVSMINNFGTSSISTFNMFDDSRLFMYAGYISELNLYDNASAELYGGTINKLRIGCILTAKGDWIADPESTAHVTLYARDVWFSSRTPPPEGYSGVLQGYWLANNEPFHIGLYGPDTYSHITIVPEPASIAFIALGGLALLRRRSCSLK